MTQQAVDPHTLAIERFNYWFACLNETDPKEGDEALEDIAQQFADDLETMLDAALSSLGLQRSVTPAERVIGYDRKTEERWAYQSDVLPKRYIRDAVDAFELGAAAPEWVLLDAVTFGASWDKRREAIAGRVR